MDDLLTAINSFMETKLPQLSRHIEQQQREYMWEFIKKHWEDINALDATSDVAILLARRLAYTLQGPTIRRFLTDSGTGAPDPEDTSKVHPIEMYIMPSIHPTLLGGDILRYQKDGTAPNDLWIVVTPSCDIEQCKANRILLARCHDLKSQKEYGKFSKCITEDRVISNSAKDELKPLVTNNRRPQKDRYFYLPGILDVPDSVVDFQDLVHVPFDRLTTNNRVASLDSPFAESFLQCFASYYGRLGTPDLHLDSVYDRLEKNHSQP